jgi:hypothetical protein
MERMRSPAIPEDPPAVLSDTELRALLKAREGTDVVARRDAAILRTFIDTGARLSEVANLRMADVDLDDQTLTVVGEGSRVRILPIGAKTVKAIDRYLRVRRSDLAELWIGGKGPMTPSGIAQMIRRRATAAGSVTSTRTSSAARSPIAGCPPKDRKAIYRRSRAGEAGRCCAATARPRGPRGHVRPIGGSHRGIGCEQRPAPSHLSPARPRDGADR